MLLPLQFASFLLAGSLLFVVAHRWRGQRALGAVIARKAAGVGQRWLGAGAVLVVMAIVSLQAPPELEPTALTALTLALLLQVVRPSFGTRLCAEHGVQSGWFWQRYEQLEEWRLSGEHLRFKVRGEWQAVELPPVEHARLREKLSRLIGDRESRFTDRQQPQLLATRSPLAMPVQGVAAAPKTEVADGGID
ncbi:MAG: hypothetical protein FJ299_12505 [Planctomycetes bacterium]|nr:hypothetical protein [Planctomycetota bacterium]